MDNLTKYKQIFISTFNVDESVLGENFTFSDTEEWDSITHMSLIAELEDSFDIMFDTNEILNFGSFENGIRILMTKGVDFSAKE